jgi:hypothetical protein
MIPNDVPNRPQGVKIKIEFTDDAGTKYSFNVEGSSKDNITKLIDFAQTMSAQSHSEDATTVDTNFAKLYGLLESRFQFGLFTSNDVLRAYQQDFQTATSLGVISTYLTRLTNRALLTRTRHGSSWIYKLARSEKQREEMIVQPTPVDLINASQIEP